MATNISDNYIFTNYSTNKSERSKTITTSGTAASASVEVTANFSSFIDGESIQLIDASGTSKTYFFDDDNTDGATGDISGSYTIVQVNGLSSADDFAEQLENAIESANGHNGTILVSRTSPTLSTLNLTQSNDGISGNTTITESGGGSFTINAGGSSAFSGGVTGETTSGSLDVAPFRISINTANNLRGQTTTSRYKVFLGEEKS